MAIRRNIFHSTVHISSLKPFLSESFLIHCLKPSWHVAECAIQELLLMPFMPEVLLSLQTELFFTSFRFAVIVKSVRPSLRRTILVLSVALTFRYDWYIQFYARLIVFIFRHCEVALEMALSVTSIWPMTSTFRDWKTRLTLLVGNVSQVIYLTIYSYRRWQFLKNPVLALSRGSNRFTRPRQQALVSLYQTL